MKRLRILTLCTILMSLGIFFFKKRTPTTVMEGNGLVVKKEWLIANKTSITPQKDVRPADQTFLTYPEWYLVFSPEEQASYFKNHTSTSFPFMSHTAQIWQGYKAVYNQIKDNYPYNGGYHFMIWVIGSSASVEYSIKAWYETIIGRLTDTHEVVTDEDKFNAKFTQDYVDFIKDYPWYEFDFKSRLLSLWKNNSFWGESFIRKMERKYILTSELIVKTVYGKLIKLGTKTVYDDAIPTTAVLVDSILNNTSVAAVKQYPDKSALLYLPRYDKFTPAICALARTGYSFKEIAGNNSAILFTVIVPETTKFEGSDLQIVFTQPIASNPTMKRVAITTPVSYLGKLLNRLIESHVEIEHVFDY